MRAGAQTRAPARADRAQLPALAWVCRRFRDLGYLGVVQIGVAYLLFSYAATRLPPLELILVPILEPLLNPVLVFLVRGDVYYFHCPR